MRLIRWYAKEKVVQNQEKATVRNIEQDEAMKRKYET
jgi:hypothetical protein